MADYSISQLTEANTADDNTLVEVVIDPDTSPNSRKMKRSAFLAGLAKTADLAAHIAATNNPHATTKAQVGLSNVPNTDATNRANHTGTQLASSISDLPEVIEDTIGTKLKAGANTSVSYNDTTGETTISSTGGGGGGGAVDSVNGQAGIVSLDQDDIADGSIAKQFTATEKAKLAAVAAGADVTATALSSAADKATPVDADALVLLDSAASGAPKKLSWANLRTTLKTSFDTLYAAVAHTHNATDINAGTLPVARGGTGKSTLASGKILTGNGTLGVQDSLSVDTDTGLTANTDSNIPTQRAVKAYVDSIASGLDLKASVRAATTTAGALASSFANGQVIDGVTLVTGNRILIKDQSTGSENGIYTVNASGAPTRAADADSSAEVTSGMFVYVEEGTANADKGFALTTNNPITLGSTALVFTPFGSGGSGTPGGSNTQLQFNNGGAFAGSAYLTTDETNKALGVAGKVNSGDFLIGNLNLTPNVVYVGDSLTYGITEASHPYNYYIHLPTWNGQTIVETNIGLGGLRITNYQERAALYQNPLFSRRAALNIAVVWGSHNDFANGVSAVQTYNALVAFCRHLRSLGWRVLVMTAISSDNGIGNFDGQKNTYNGLIRHSWQDFADMLVDVAANPLLGADGAHSNGTYFHDGVHLTDTGYALVASIVEPALISYLEQATTIAAHKKGSVIHAEDADFPRPIGYETVEWLGSVSPNNATDYDTWIGPATI